MDKPRDGMYIENELTIWLDRKMKWVFKINDIFSIVIQMLNVVMVKFVD